VVPILVQATMQGVVLVIIVYIMMLSLLLVVFLCIIDNICNDGRNIIIVGDGGGIICRSADVMITI